MGRIKRFENIDAWKKSRHLVNDVYGVSSDDKFFRDYGLRDQVRRAAVSGMLNIAEGFARKTDREFSQFFYIAHGSLAEVQSALYVALDQNYLDEILFKQLYEQCEEISRMLSGLITYLRSSSKRGNTATP